jgi:D-alanyl-D-alanine carboxypeptidase
VAFVVKSRSCAYRIGHIAVSLALVLAANVGAALASGPTVVFDAEDGRILYADDADLPWYPASLTKLMTAYMVFDALQKGDLTPKMELILSENALAQPKSRVGIRGGRRITVEQALQGLIIRSANDYAVGLAEAMSGSEEAFVADMNRAALGLGMVRTQFANANGLPGDGQATTARDMALLARAIIHRFPEYSPLFSMESAQMGRITINSHNELLKNFEGADGMKTGFTCGAGYNIVASATRKGRKIVAVVLGESTGGKRSARAATLLDEAFARPVPPGPADETIDPTPVRGEELIDAPPAFSLAQKASQIQHVRKCFDFVPPPRKPTVKAAVAPTTPPAATPAPAPTPALVPDPKRQAGR